MGAVDESLGHGLFIKVYLLLSALALSIHGFQLPQRPGNLNPSPLIFRAKAAGPAEVTAKESGNVRGVNGRVREIMELIESRTTNFEGGKDGDSRKPGSQWAKARRYFYYKTELTPAQVNKVVDFLEDVLQQDRGLLASVIRTNPRILRFSVERYLRPTALFLKKLYGNDLFLEAVRRNPGLLLSRGMGCDAPEESIVAVENYFVDFLGVRQLDLKVLKDDAPWLFRLSLSSVQSSVTFFQGVLHHNGKSEDTNRRTIGKLLKLYPTLFNISAEKGLAPKVDFLVQECGLSRGDVASLLKGHRAAVFCLSVEDSLEPSVEFIKELLASSGPEATTQRLRKCIVAHPDILHLSKQNVMEKVSYFELIDSMCPSKPETSLASRVAIRSPSVYSLSLQDNIIPKIEFLCKIWGVEAPTDGDEGRSVADESEDSMYNKRSFLATLLSEYPTILTMSLEANIQPTINFYNRTGFTKLDENWDLCRNDSITSFAPLVRARYIASSLFQRLLPRWHYYLANKNRCGRKLKMLPLHILAGSDDEKFCSFLGVAVQDFKKFKMEAVPRLKFSSQFDTWLKTGRPIE